MLPRRALLSLALLLPLSLCAQVTDQVSGPVVVAAGIEQVVEIGRLMGTVKIADAEMQDAGRQSRAVVTGNLNTGCE